MGSQMQQSTKGKKSFWKYILIGIFVLVFVLVPILFSLFYDPLDADVPQAVCTMKCGFSLSPGVPEGPLVGEGSLTVTGYNNYPRSEEDKENYKIVGKTFSESQIENLKTGKKDVNGMDRIKGELDGSRCVYMGFARESGSESLTKCK